MKNDQVKARNQNDAVTLSLWLNESRHSLDAAPLRLNVAAKVRMKNNLV